jgi:hypothetical protein
MGTVFKADEAQTPAEAAAPILSLAPRGWRHCHRVRSLRTESSWSGCT